MEPNQQYQPKNSQIPPSSPIRSEIPGTSHEWNKKVGPIIATLVIILALVIAALYFFATKINEQSISPVNTNQGLETQIDSQAQSPSVPAVTRTSDNPADLQADLDASIEGLEDQNF